MSAFKTSHLVVEDHFDKEDELEVELEGDSDPSFAWLSREEVVRLRDHLNKVLGVAP